MLYEVITQIRRLLLDLKGLDIKRLPFRRREVELFPVFEPASARITSYNVCYTKLLRLLKPRNGLLRETDGVQKRSLMPLCQAGPLHKIGFLFR